ncbi:M60 family metallopeptidase [Kribbella catacumbae]|uniref:M60 family metallopeptidase n=1 Tax=Kribbella catacumbae TaxID=460086 RepID=UPI00037E8758|nr:M60 family metallopeptidase [Kribbella catacumbae]
MIDPTHLTRRSALGLIAGGTLAGAAGLAPTAAEARPADPAGERSRTAKTGALTFAVKPRRSADADRAALCVTYTPRTDLQPTGHYVAPGDVLTVTLDASIQEGDPLPRITVGAPNTQRDENDKNIDHTRPYDLAKGVNKVSDPYGGPIYFSWPVQSRKSQSTATVAISGHTRPVPTFRLGVTSEKEFQRQLDRHDTPFVELIGEQALLSFHRHQVLRYRNESHTALLRTIDRAIEIEDRLAGYGLDADAPSPAGPHHLVGYPGNIPGAAAQAWFQFTTYSESEHPDVLTVSGVRTHGWGIYHEVGHQHQVDKITPGVLGEETNENFSYAVQRRFTEAYGQQPRARAINKSGTSRWDDLMASRGATDIKDVKWRQLIFEQLRIAYGEGVLTDWYRVVRQQYAQLPDGGTTNAERDLTRWQNVVWTTSHAAGVDLTDFWAGWGVTVTDQTRANVRRLGVPAPAVDLAALRETNIDEPSVWPN